MNEKVEDVPVAETVEETAKSENQKYMEKFVEELTRLVHEGNSAGQRVTCLSAVVLYTDGETYIHTAGEPDHVRMIGAMEFQKAGLISEHNNRIWDTEQEGQVKWPPLRSEVELGFRFGSGVRAAVKRTKTEIEIEEAVALSKEQGVQ